ncbi:response regulator [Mesonia ostreae]|uniref:Response regulator n=1 Tax=Mesonia ostreae TaxID=861110 RepID=A0ABU2KG58_9FLAO|nr:response regulator [Mesonia ostreae]MDT0293697.1 response regulator [Mesonia ostreae]
MTKSQKHFIIVDDDALNNILTRMILTKAFDDVLIHIFSIPEDSLEFMKSQSNHSQPNEKIVLFLDINMPSLSAWEYLEEFNLFDTSIKEQYEIYILSSSIDPKDINRAKDSRLVKDFIEKPLRKEILLTMFNV